MFEVIKKYFTPVKPLILYRSGWVFDGANIVEDLHLRQKDSSIACEYNREPTIGSDWWYSPVLNHDIRKQSIYNTEEKCRAVIIRSFNQEIAELTKIRDSLEKALKTLWCPANSIEATFIREYENKEFINSYKTLIFYPKWSEELACKEIDGWNNKAGPITEFKINKEFMEQFVHFAVYDDYDHTSYRIPHKDYEKFNKMIEGPICLWKSWNTETILNE